MRCRCIGSKDRSDGVSRDVQRPNEKLCRDRSLQQCPLDVSTCRPWHELIRIFRAMGWADWMVVHQSLEEELELERNVRDVQKAAVDEDAT